MGWGVKQSLVLCRGGRADFPDPISGSRAQSDRTIIEICFILAAWLVYYT